MDRNDFNFIDDSRFFGDFRTQIDEFFRIGDVPDAQAGKLRKISEFIVKRVLKLEGKSDWYKTAVDQNGNSIQNPSFAQNIGYLRDLDIFPRGIIGKLNDIRYGGNRGMHNEDAKAPTQTDVSELIVKLHDVFVYFINTYEGTQYRYSEGSGMNSLSYRKPELFKRRSVVNDTDNSQPSNNTNVSIDDLYAGVSRGHSINDSVNDEPKSKPINRDQSVTSSTRSSRENTDNFSKTQPHESTNNSQTYRPTIHQKPVSNYNPDNDNQSETWKKIKIFLIVLVGFFAIALLINSCTKNSSQNYSSDNYSEDSDDGSDSDDEEYTGNWVKGKVFEITISTEKIEATKNGSTSDYDDVLPQLNYPHSYIAFDPNGKRFIVTDYADEAYNIVKSESNFNYALKNYYSNEKKDTYTIKNQKITLNQPNNGWNATYDISTTEKDGVTFSNSGEKKVQDWFNHMLYKADIDVDDNGNDETNFDYTSTLRFGPKDFDYVKGKYNAKYTLEVKFNLLENADNETNVASDDEKVDDKTSSKNWLAGRMYELSVKTDSAYNPAYDWSDSYSDVKLPYLKYDDFYVVFDPDSSKNRALGTPSMLDASDASSSKKKFDTLYAKQKENWKYDFSHNYLDLYMSNLKWTYDDSGNDTVDFSNKGDKDIQYMLSSGMYGLYLTKNRANTVRNTYYDFDDKDFKDTSNYYPRFKVETQFKYVGSDGD